MRKSTVSFASLFSLGFAALVAMGAAQSFGAELCLAVRDSDAFGQRETYEVRCENGDEIQLGYSRNRGRLQNELIDTLSERNYTISHLYFDGRLYLFEKTASEKPSFQRYCVGWRQLVSGQAGMFGGSHMKFEADCGDTYTYQLKNPTDAGVKDFAREIGAVELMTKEAFRMNARPREAYTIFQKRP